MKIAFVKNLLLNSLPFIFIFISSLYRPYDADLGWHLKYGEYFFKTGQILRENIYSTEMAGFAWANTGWMTDIITYKIFDIAGFLGLTVASALVVTLTLWVFSKAFELSLYQKAFIFPVLVLFEMPVNQISFRGQLVSIFLLGVLMYSLLQIKPKLQLIFIPLLFAIWVNLHGQFIVGLSVLVLFSGLKVFESISDDLVKINMSLLFHALNINKHLLKIIGLSILATLINPFGILIYKTALVHFSSPDLKSIVEYLPIEDLSDEWWKQMLYGIMLFFGVLSLIFSGQFKKNISKVGTIFIFYLLAFWVRRYAWSMYYLGIPLLKPVADFLKPDSEKNSARAALALFAIFIIFAIHVKQPFERYFNMNWDIYCKEYTNCSPKAIQFLIDNKLDKNLLTMYNWGGFMIWNYPQIKPSIDGRMHLWKDDKGYSAFSKYYSLEQNTAEIEYAGYDTVLIGNEKPLYERLEELVGEGKWEKKFEDEYAGVFVRKK